MTSKVPIKITEQEQYILYILEHHGSQTVEKMIEISRGHIDRAKVYTWLARLELAGLIVYDMRKDHKGEEKRHYRLCERVVDHL